MALNTQDFKHLELMADLENLPVEERDYDELVHYEPQKSPPSLSENILALCSRLRASGFEKQADGLEDKFSQYKLATVDYDPIIEEAHPEGDVEIVPDKEDLGDVETIISQQEKDLDIVNQMPTGKMAFVGLMGFKTASPLDRVLADLKIALAQDVRQMLPKADAEIQLKEKMVELNSALSQINEKVNGELTLPLTDYTDAIQELSKSPTLDNLEKIRERYEQLIARLHPEPTKSSTIKSTLWSIYNVVGTIGLTEDTWEIMEQEIKAPLQIINYALSLRKTIIAQQNVRSIPEVTIKSNPEEVILNKSIKDIRTYEQLLNNNLVKNITEAEKKEALKWVEEERKELYELRDNYNKLIESPDYNQAIVDAMNKKIEEAKGYVETFYTDWIK